MATGEKKTKSRSELSKEVIDLVIKRSGVSKQSIIKTAFKGFFANNMDLLTEEERKKYQSVILQ